MAAASGAIASFVVGSALFDVLSFAHVTYMLMFILGLIVAAQHPERDEDPGSRLIRLRVCGYIVGP